MRYFVVLILLFQLHIVSRAQTVYQNQILNQQIKTPLVYPEGNPLGYPIISLYGEKLEFHFDDMTTELNEYSYAVFHCNHLWQKSDISSNEYIQGFPSQSITTYDVAFNTQVEYVHHQFVFPNDMMKPRYSGNYLVAIFTGNEPEDESSWVLTYRIVVYESLTEIEGSAKMSNYIAERFHNQDVNFTVSHANYSIPDPQRDVHVTLLQNMDWGTSITNLKPVFQNNNLLTYQYTMGENMFLGGSEYRNFEIKSMQYASIEVETIQQESDAFHAYLRADLPVGNKTYSTQIDLNGTYLIKNDLADDSNLESDYVWVHFLMTMPQMEESEVFIEGRFSDFDAQKIKCTYDQKLNGYVAKVLLKQGYYNYRYFIQDKFFSRKDLSRTEGNYSQTENAYQILVYAYDRNWGCDRLIGTRYLNSNR